MHNLHITLTHTVWHTDDQLIIKCIGFLPRRSILFIIKKNNIVQRARFMPAKLKVFQENLIKTTYTRIFQLVVQLVKNNMKNTIYGVYGSIIMQIQFCWAHILNTQNNTYRECLIKWSLFFHKPSGREKNLNLSFKTCRFILKSILQICYETYHTCTHTRTVYINIS